MKMRKIGAYLAALALTSSLIAPGFAHEERRYPLNNWVGGINPAANQQAGGSGGDQGLGQISIFVGFHAEPAFEDTYNGVDVIMTSFRGWCPNTHDKNAIETVLSKRANGDTVNLDVDAFYYPTASKPTSLGNLPPPVSPIASLTLTKVSPLKELFGENGTYNTYFRPTHPATSGIVVPPATTPGVGALGAYGFHVYGTVKAKASTATCPAEPDFGIAETTYNIPATGDVAIDAYYVCGAGGGLTGSFNCVLQSQPFPGKLPDAYSPNTPYRKYNY
jgi:hypothetical protein